MQMNAARPVVALLIGTGVMVTNGKALVRDVVGLKHIADAQLGVIASTICAAVFSGILLLGIAIPTVLYAANRQQAVSPLTHLRQWIAGHARLLMIFVSLVLGTYLVNRWVSISPATHTTPPALANGWPDKLRLTSSPHERLVAYPRYAPLC
jgi:hypothetical protein